jgi:glycosyltransferase involved in cell wall biosynthesis
VLHTRYARPECEWARRRDRSAVGWVSSVTPEITAIVPSHNRRDFLRLTLRSVLSQRGVNLEVIVVDDGSSDDVAAVVAALGDGRIRLIRHERSTGVSTARNHGAEAARSDWLAFCDDDDLWSPHKLARQLAAAADAHRTWSYGGAVHINSTLRITSGAPPPRPERLLERLPSWTLMPGGSSNVIMKREMFREAGGWDPGLVNLADWDLWIRLARLGGPACVAEPLVGYRVHSGNASANIALVLREARLMDGRYDNRVDYGELYHYLGWVCLRSVRRRLAVNHFTRAAFRGAIAAVGRSATDIARAQLRQLLRDPTPFNPDPAWCQQAEAWVAELRAP